MAAITLGFKIWDSTNFLACCSAQSDSGSGSGSLIPADVISCGDGWNPRGAQLVPHVNCDTGTIRWDLWDNLTSYPDNAGARNGIAVTNPETGVITLWDVSGAFDSSTEETVATKLYNFLQVCNCTDCEGGTVILAGEYECVYPSVPISTYCYDVTFIGNGGTLEIRTFAMMYNANLIGYPIQTAYNLSTGSTKLRVCLNKPISEIGHSANHTWSLA